MERKAYWRQFSALISPLSQGYDLCLGGETSIRCDCMAMLGHIWGGRRTDPRPGSLGIYRARLRHCATFSLELREGNFTDGACHTMAQGEQNGNGWMVLWKMGSPKKSPESPAASETRWKATVAPPHSQGAGWTSSREREKKLGQRAQVERQTLPHGPDQGGQPGWTV